MLGLLAQPKQQSTDATIITLSDRLAHSTDLEDRRAAALSLKGFSRGHRELVASMGLRGIINALHTDGDDQEMRRACLETLIILFITASTVDADFAETARRVRQRNKRYISPLLAARTARGDVDVVAPVDEISLWLSDAFIQKEDAIETLLGFVSAKDAFSSLYALQLLSALAANRPERAKEAILAVHSSVSVLVHALDSSMDMLRGEAILLLITLTTGNIEFQKLVAFEGAFEKLFEVIEEEGGVLYGSATVENCLELLTSLLQYNVSNQKLFCESQCAPKYCRLIQPAEDLTNWPESAIVNMNAALHLSRLFTTPGAEATQHNQDVLARAGLLMETLRLAFGPVTPLVVRVSALLSTCSLIYENKPRQEEFLSVDVPYYDLSVSMNVQKTPTELPVSQALLNWTLLPSTSHMFDLRAVSQLTLAASYKGNEPAKREFLKTQISGFVTEQEMSTRTHNANLLSILAEYDEDTKLNPFKIWFAAAVVMSIFADAPDTKDILQQVTVGDSKLGQEEMPLISALSGQLLGSLRLSEPIIAIGYLMLLITWLYDDKTAVNDFLSDSAVPHALISYITTNRSGHGNIIAESLATILLGVAYDFSSSESAITRVDFHKLLSSTIGRDQYALQVQRFKESPQYKAFEPANIIGATKNESGLPNVTLESTFVTLMSETINRIQRAIEINPEMETSTKISLDMYEELKVKLHNNMLKNREIHDSQAAQISSLTEDLKVVTSDLEGRAAALKDLEKKHGEVVDTRNKLEAEVTRLEDDLEALRKQLATVKESKEKLQADLKSKEVVLEALEKDHKNLKSQTYTLNAAKEKAETGVNKLTRELMTLSKEKATSKESGRKLSSDLASKLKIIEKLETNLKSLQTKSQDSDKQLREEKDALAELKKVNEKLIEKLKYTANILKEKEEDEEILEQALSEVEKLKAENQKLQNELRNNAQSIAEQKSLKEDIQNIQEELEQKSSELARVLVELKDSNAKKELQQEYNKDEKIVTAELEKTKKELEYRISKCEELENKALDTEKAKETCEESFKALQQEHSALTNELASCKEQVAEKKTLVETLKAELLDIKTAGSSNGGLGEVPNTKTKKKGSKSSPNTQDQKSTDDQTSSEELSDLREKLEQQTKSTNELKMLNAELLKTRKQQSDAQEKDLKSLQAELDAAKTKLEAASKSASEDDKKSNVEAVEAQDQKIATLQSELSEKSDALDELMVLLDDLTDKKNKYKLKLTELDQEVSDSEAEDV